MRELRGLTEIGLLGAANQGQGGGVPAGAGYLVDTDLSYLVDTAGNRRIGRATTDNPATATKTLAASKGLLFGTSIQGNAVMAQTGPSGYATRLEWVAANTDLFVPGSVMMPDNYNPSLGVFNMSGVTAFLDDARARGKKVRAHCSFYPKRDIGTWIDTYLQANPAQWQALQNARIDALCAVLANYSDVLTNIDVTNEVHSAGSSNPGGYRTNPWNTAVATVAGRDASTAILADYEAPIIAAYQRVAQQLPGVDRYWCQDLSEQLGSGTFQTMAANILAGITSCRTAGASITGYNMQAHLTYRLSFDPVRLRSFCQGLTSTLGLKLIVGELDARTGYDSGFGDTPAPADMSVFDYDRKGADLYKQFLDVALPFVVASGGRQLLSWTLDDGYNSWPVTPGERPCPYDTAYQPKPQLTAIRNALLEL